MKSNLEDSSPIYCFRILRGFALKQLLKEFFHACLIVKLVEFSRNFSHYILLIWKKEGKRKKGERKGEKVGANGLFCNFASLSGTLMEIIITAGARDAQFSPLGSSLSVQLCRLLFFICSILCSRFTLLWRSPPPFLARFPRIQNNPVQCFEPREAKSNIEISSMIPAPNERIILAEICLFFLLISRILHRNDFPSNSIIAIAVSIPIRWK